MKSSTSSMIFTSLTLSSTTSAFSFMTGGKMHTNTKLSSSTEEFISSSPVVVAEEAFVEGRSTNAITDPLGLYPNSSDERMAGVIEPLEASFEQQDRMITDPLSLYPDPSSTTGVIMSASLPFLPRPVGLGAINQIPGDRGFDPFNLATDSEKLLWYREAEIKHARLAMLASVGWIASEFFDQDIAQLMGMNVVVDEFGRVPSVLNGGLDQINPYFWMEAICAASLLEFMTIRNANQEQPREPGDLNFDPLKFGGEGEYRFEMQESELVNGRLAMLAITSFAVQECLTNDSVVHQLFGL